MESYQDLLAKFNDLAKLVEKTADANKVKDFERSKVKLNNFAFSIKLYPEDTDD